MKTSDNSARLKAAHVLIAMGKEGTSTKEAIQDLQACLTDKSPEVRGWAAVALVYATRGTPFPFDRIAGPALKEAAESSDAELRAQAGELVSRMSAGGGGPPGKGGANPERGKQGTERPATDEKEKP